MRRIILSSVAHMPATVFFHLSHKRHDFREKSVDRKTCFDFLCNFCLKRDSKKNSMRYVKCT